MRCVVCDASDVGMSLYSDHKKLGRHYHDTPEGIYCDSCFESGEDVIDEWNFEQTMEDEEESAFDYE